jgi:hypothetical protein
MLETFLALTKVVLLVTVAIPMAMGLVMSLLGFVVLEWTRYVDRRVERAASDSSVLATADS